jgi:hypothetical protein
MLTCPNIAFSVNKVCQFLHVPTMLHWCAVKRILRYIHGSIQLGIKFVKDKSSLLSAYSVADWLGVLTIEDQLVVLRCSSDQI